jgi:cytochrome c2
MTFSRNMLRRTIVASAMVVGLAGAGMTAAVAADTGKGAKVFKKCAACHSLKAGKKKVGPSLHGLYGRTAGTFVDAKGKKFKHSKDLVAAGAAGLVWDAQNFAGYIAKPKPYIGEMIGKKKAKTKMAFNGLKKAKDVENLVAYLEPYAKGEKEGKK